MNSRERALLALAVVGFVVPNTMVIAFVIDHGFDIGRYFDAWVQSLPAAQLAADLGIAFLAFAVWSAWEGRRLGMRAWWLAIPASALVGLCFAVPLFLFLRERAASARGRPAPPPRSPSPPPQPAPERAT